MRLTPYDHTSSKALLPSKHNGTHDPPTPLPLNPTPIVNVPCTDALSTAIDRSYVSGHWHYSCMTSTPQTMPLLMLYMPSNIDLHNDFCRHKSGASGKEWKKICKDGRAVIQKHPPQKKSCREVDGFLISVRNQTASERGERSVAAAESSTSCQESGSSLQSEDKTSFSLWLKHWWIILLFRQALLAYR